MDKTDIDTLLAIIGNPTRRRILKKLSREIHYPLQLSKELNISQQSIMKHLRVLEENDMVVSIVQKSDSGGPPRKYYASTSRFSLIIDVSPSIFNEEIRVYESVTEMDVSPPELEDDKGLKNEKRGMLIELASTIAEVNGKIREIEEERSGLLVEKEKLMKIAYELLEDLCDSYDERKVLRYILEEDDISIGRMSDVLNMREMDIERIMRGLEDLGLLELHRKIIYM